MDRHLRWLAAAVMAASVGASPCATTVAAQVRGAHGAAQRTPLNAADEVERQARIAVTGDLGFAPLPAVYEDSPRDNFLYADRLPHGDSPPSGTIAAVTKVQTSLPASLTGTGFAEFIQYQLPEAYDGSGPPHPLIVAYHGYGGSCTSPANLSTVDEEANTRNWVYLAVTGLDDQLFGTPISQQNTTAAIQWMLDGFNIDADRIYMVGFSVGGGIVANYAARHRDPDGVMIAAIGTVCGTTDWTLEYNINPFVQGWMENAYNFGGTPTAQAFRYQQASAAYHDTGSYPPPTAALLVDSVSMLHNLGPVPTYVTYDTDDGITHVPHMGDELESSVASLGGVTFKRVQTGTVLPGPPSVPAPHSWAVLDEVEFFDFLEGHTAQRVPQDFQAQLDLGGDVAWVTAIQDVTGAFTYVDGDADPGSNRITLSQLQNTDRLRVDVGSAGVTGDLPVRVTIENLGPSDTRVQLTGFAQTPSRMKHVGSNALVTLVDSDPATGSLFVVVPAGTTFDARVLHDPTWTSVITTSPTPVAIGETLDVSIDGPDTSITTYLVVSMSEVLTPVGDVVITAYPVPPVFIMALPLDLQGDISFSQVVPNEPVLSGVRFPTQAVTVTSAGVLESVSNLWGLYVD